MLLAAGLGAATYFFPSSSTKMGSTTQEQTVFANGQFLIRQTQTIVHAESIEHSSHAVFKIGFWNIIPWTLIFPILWLRSLLVRRAKSKDDLPNLQNRRGRV